MKHIFAAIVLTATTGLAVAAPQPAPTTAPAAATAAPAVPAVPKQTHDDIMELLDLTFKPRINDMAMVMSKVLVSQMQAKSRDISPAVADEISQDVVQAVNQPDRVKQLEEDLVPVYAQAYSDDEIRQLIAFGKTPAGAKMYAGTPNQKQISAAMQPWVLGVLAPVVMMDTARILKAHGITMDSDR